MLDSFNSMVTKLGGEIPNLTVFGTVGIIITLVIALLYCFFGYKFLKAFVALIGFVIGMAIGFLIASRVGANTVVTWILIFVFAIALGIVSFFLYRVGIFIVTFFLILGLVYQFTADKLSAPWPVVAALIAGLVVAILAVVFIRPMAILTSGICGGMGFALTLINDLVKWQNAYAQVLVFVFGAAIAVLGIVFQFKTTVKGK